MMRLYFFNYLASAEIYTLSLPDALPSFAVAAVASAGDDSALYQLLSTVSRAPVYVATATVLVHLDRKSTLLNSSHANISYAVFCLNKTKQSEGIHTRSVIKGLAKTYTYS